MRLKNIKIRPRLVFVFTLLLTCNSFAADVTEIPIEHVPKGTTGFGFGWRVGTNSYVNLDNVSSNKNEKESDLLPLYLYEGKYFFAHGSRAGIHILRDEAFEIDFLAKYRFDKLEPDTDDFFNTVSEREQTVDAGLHLRIKQDWGELGFTGIHDILGNHNGYEFEVSYRKPFRSQHWFFSPYISLIHQNDELVDYYYGVSADEARPDLPEYQAQGGEFWRMGINTSYRVKPWLYLFANISFESLVEDAENSPLTEESYSTNAMLGFAALVGNATEDEYVSSADLLDESVRQWSWRINYGYTAEGIFNKIHRGDFRKNEEYPTNLAGITIGKLLSDNEKIDFWGKVSVNRRFEKEFQPDFWEYEAYVMAVGTSYSSKTAKEVFRYGFGFGFSYAEDIPIIEKVKQEERGRETSHFLNYLEVQVDWPLSFIFGDSASSNCYLGATLVHRSGIFANADLLGNVNGGSNVITGHLECKV